MRPKSPEIDDRPAFRHQLTQCDPELVALFERLSNLARIACHCDDCGYTDKPDFRLCWEHIVCEMIPKPKKRGVLVMLRVDRSPVDDLFASLRAIQVRDVVDNSHSKPGGKRASRPNTDSRWIQFEVSEPDQIPDALAIISRVFTDRRASGWGKP